MTLSGRSIIGFRRGSDTSRTFTARDPVSGQALDPEFASAGSDEIEQAVRLSAQAFEAYGRLPGREKGKLLRRIASNLENIAAVVVERASRETALPRARLEGETARTCNQLRLFAGVVEEGSWLMARIDRPDPERKPAAKPDIRSMLRPLGPVVVFAASNFPLAFSVAGGDTASALASGNPVIVKAHPAHPGTSELVGQAIGRAVQDCDLPEGVFSLLFDGGNHVGTALVKHPLVKAGGFTGSRAAGITLMQMAAARPEPIPFFAEMSSTNPVFILPGALEEKAEQIAAGLHSSFTLGGGQFCTKPGMVFIPEGEAAGRFSTLLGERLRPPASFHLLTEAIRSSYKSGIESRRKKSGLKALAEFSPDSDSAVGAAIFMTDAKAFLDDPQLGIEIFGPVTLLVRHSSRDELFEIARTLEGHLTATIHGTEEDLERFAELIRVLENKVGRLVFNGFPTGVEVGHATVHGGPFPATSDGRTTSVGSLAIYRFCRPLCYQGFPPAVLPPELKDTNPLGIWRMVDGQLTKEPVTVGLEVKGQAQ
ncbi:MAG: aldehyde dehydrogenase (NADP(+)) [Acidobacteria bacterium]|nr:aldehyde dehydrogenase (NADP(+)) [Acidobacteriota bacterium]MBV9624148.1 aldehyde dehydrogenase (NADP(+)) [Acidobacteriota bacterium]